IEHTQELLAEMQAAFSDGTFRGFDISLMTDEEKSKFLEDVEELKAKLIELGVAKADLQNGGGEDVSSESSDSYGMGGQTDVLGMTPENWEVFFQNIQEGTYGIEEMTATVGMLQNAMNSYFSYVQAAQQREIAQFDQATNRKRNSLKKQLDQGIISQEMYDKKLQKLEEEADKRRAKMEYEAAM